MPFQKPRILTDNESNRIRGKCLVAKATAEELMQLIGHFDLLVDELETALESAIETIHGWHDMPHGGIQPETTKAGVWAIYLRSAPEMRRLTAALAKARGEAAPAGGGA